jgi:hypothetical protein
MIRTVLSIVGFGFCFSCQSAGNTYGYDNDAQSPLKRDPFTTSERMYAEVGQQAQKGAGYGGFIAGYGTQNIPKMHLKGFVTRSSGATAILEIEGAGVYMVSKGDEIGLHAIGQNTVLKVVDISSNGVKVQSGRVNQVIIVR